MDNSAKTGSAAERKFEKICKKRGYKVTKANDDQNMHEHWDYKVEKNKGPKLVDVKAAKKISRGDKDVSYDWTWVEIKNVHGNAGWLKGKADCIAFGQKDHFLIVQREELRVWCKEKINLKKKVSNTKDAKYNLYSRKGRKDLLSLISIEEMRKEIKCWEFKA